MGATEAYLHARTNTALKYQHKTFAPNNYDETFEIFVAPATLTPIIRGVERVAYLINFLPTKCHQPVF